MVFFCSFIMFAANLQVSHSFLGGVFSSFFFFGLLSGEKKTGSFVSTKKYVLCRVQIFILHCSALAGTFIVRQVVCLFFFFFL